MISSPSGPRRSRSAARSGRAPPGCPPLRAVIVLTVKLFGETLKAPRTLAVWHGRTAAKLNSAKH
ncbi:hypothetical protein FNH04_14030 [Streptomyces phyllanthi]|uniref:Uncharacterized protein n=1 Tax=Streptomyces phyllanthi TaxID=1803180 RepID=A0A5N8W1J7_9ACTN|nr:hypothetical protein [Streptomyces phyllanthi]